MAARLAWIGVAVAVAVLAGGASAQTTPPSSSACTQTLLSMSPCLNYLTGNETTPSASCCSKLGDVVKAQPECLCVALNADPAALGLSINRTRALGLPDACKVQTPPVSNCKSGAAPPAGQTPTPAGTGSKATPVTPVGSGVVPLRVSPAGLLAGLVVAAVYAVSAV
ncbi:non-specific lipid transfer protein GPI-anchored 5-like [Oryza brachyantha]|uniref:Bifunctional inhibitor/plant lipid transfer protein/seed storage helical domain-containing protein n=1 Tax=Oryza brachyantha TaxID=4533 RepID=J3MIY9_ORYBR|nr:non-specific lipid transfer protein GPI-anchored 5-like [Oryza brachyantha]